MKDFKITLHQIGTEAVAIMALQAENAKKAIVKAQRCMGNDWFTVVVEG